MSLRHALIQQDEQYKEIIRVNQNRIDKLENEKTERISVNILPDEKNNESKVPTTEESSKENQQQQQQQQEKHQQEIYLRVAGGGGSKISTRSGL